MKIILLCILVILIMLIAIGISKQYKDKFEFYRQLNNFLNYYEINISFKKEKIIEIIKKYKTNTNFLILLNEYIRHLDKNSNINLNNIKILDEDENKYLIDLFSNLGCSDYTTEIKNLSAHKKIILEKLDETKNNKNKLCPLIIKLSLLFAIGIAIILI